MPTGVYIRHKTRGRTKENDPGRAAQAEKMRGRTKENHPGIARMAEKLRGVKRGFRTPREVISCGYLDCGNTFERRVGEDRKYCSRKCYWKSMEGQISCNRGRKHSKEFGKHRSISQENLWKDPEYKEKQLKAMFKGLGLLPNRPEKFLIKLLQELYPNQWKYMGDGKDGDSIVAGKCPDFIHVSQKKIIEHFGEYHHGESVTGISNEQHEQQRINLFTKHGYQTLVIWEHELSNTDEVIFRIQEFNNAGNI